MLHAERIRITKLVDMAEAVAIGNGDKTVPDSWIDLMTDDPRERARWKMNEWKRSEFRS